MTIERFLSFSQERLMKLLRRRVWLQEKLQPTDWQATLLWAGLAGFLGALAAIVFTACTEGVHELLTGSRAGVVESMRLLPPWAVVIVPGIGGLLAGLVLLFGQRLAPRANSTDYMEAILIGSGRIPLRASLVKCTAALFSIGSGGSIGREGPMVQLAAVVSSWLGRWRNFTPPKQRLLVACGASAGIASAYNAPIGGSFFVAEIILGSIAMESLGPLVVSAVAATLTIRAVNHAEQLYQVQPYRMNSLWEIGLFVLLGLIVGTVAPWFLRSLRGAERLLGALRLPLALRLALGGLLVGAAAVFVPEVCGNGYTVVVSILRGEYVWQILLLILACKWFATSASFGSGAPGGVFTPSLFVGASSGFIFGSAVQLIWPAAGADPRAFALVGMGAFLAAVSHAPVMAIIMIFEMTLSYDIILPLMLCCVVAYFTAKSLEGDSLYSEALRKKAASAPPTNLKLAASTVGQLMRTDPPTLSRNATFAEIGRVFLANRLNNLYVVDENGSFLGIVSLHDIKPFLQQPELAHVVIAADILHDNFPSIRPDESLGTGLQRFLGLPAERLPVVDEAGKLVGSLSKGDLLLSLSEERTAKPAPA
jgi:chloride channel protein, CIC family